MAKTIKVKNPLLPQNEDTFLTAKYTSGTALTVKNNEGWADNDIAVVGQPGDEKTEQQAVASTTGATTITLDSGLNFDHPIETPIFRSSWNQISLERKPSGGSFTEIAEGKKYIEWDEKDGYTKIPVAAGADSDTYRWRFYNTASATYDDYSGEMPGTGLTQFYVGSLIDSVRYFGKIPANLGITDAQILRSLNRGQMQVDTMAPDGRWWFALTEDTDSTRITSVANTYKYDLPSNFRSMDVVKVLDENNMKYNLSFTPLIEFDSYKINNADTATHNNNIRVWTLLPPDSSNTVGYFGVHSTPEDTSLYFYRRYWRFLPTLTSFASQTLIPLPEVLLSYALYELWKLRQDRDNALFYFQQFTDNVGLLKRLQRRQIGQAEFQRFRGQRGYSNLFGGANFPTDQSREDYW